jgi:hypothetical protein
MLTKLLIPERLPFTRHLQAHHHIYLIQKTNIRTNRLLSKYTHLLRVLHPTCAPARKILVHSRLPLAHHRTLLKAYRNKLHKSRTSQIYTTKL